MRKIVFFSCLLCLYTAHVAAQSLPKDVAKYLNQHLTSLHLEQSDIKEAIVSDAYTSKGINHLYLQQKHQGLKVFNGLMSIAITSNGRIVISGNRFVSHLQSNIENQSLTLSPENYST